MVAMMMMTQLEQDDSKLSLIHCIATISHHLHTVNFSYTICFFLQPLSHDFFVTEEGANNLPKQKEVSRRKKGEGRKQRKRNAKGSQLEGEKRKRNEGEKRKRNEGEKRKRIEGENPSLQFLVLTSQLPLDSSSYTCV